MKCDEFPWGNILVEYRAESNTYKVYDNMIGALLGRFKFAEGPGWVFYAAGGLIMDELPALADFFLELQAISLEDMGVE